MDRKSNKATGKAIRRKAKALPPTEFQGRLAAAHFSTCQVCGVQIKRNSGTT